MKEWLFLLTIFMLGALLSLAAVFLVFWLREFDSEDNVLEPTPPVPDGALPIQESGTGDCSRQRLKEWIGRKLPTPKLLLTNERHGNHV